MTIWQGHYSREAREGGTLAMVAAMVADLANTQRVVATEVVLAPDVYMCLAAQVGPLDEGDPRVLGLRVRVDHELPAGRVWVH